MLTPARCQRRSSAASRDGGVAVFPADTVYGLACDPENPAARRAPVRAQGPPAGQARRGAVLRRRARARRAARARGAAARRRRGAAARPGHGAAAEPAPALRAGVRPGPRDARAARSRARRRAGGARVGRCPCSSRAPTSRAAPDARRLEDVPLAMREGADLVLDGGELPGTPRRWSTCAAT